MGRMRFGLAVVVAAVLLAAGCGEGGDDANVVTTNAVAAALADTVEVPVYRATTSASQTFKIPAMGVDSDNDIDGVDLTIVATVSRDRQHFALSIGLPPETQMDGDDDIEFEVWSDSERFVMDTRDYQRLVDAAPGVELGPVAPGLFFVDTASIGADNPELLNALVGFSTPSLKDLAENLPAALNNLDQTSENPLTYVGSTTVAKLQEAQGADISVTARSMVAAMSLILPAGIDELFELLVEALEAAVAEVIIEIDDRGLLRALSTRQDLSGVFTAISEATEAFPDMTEQERHEVAAELEGAELIVGTQSVYETDSDLEVSLPPEATEDRTDQWREYLITAGFDDGG